MRAANARSPNVEKEQKSSKSGSYRYDNSRKLTVILNMTYLKDNFIESETKLDLTGAMKDSDCCHQFLVRNADVPHLFPFSASYMHIN